MADIAVRATASGLQRLSSRLKHLVDRATNLRDFMEDAARYMVRSTQNRIYRTHRDPDGNAWAALAALTVELKGHDDPLFETGQLVRSIHVENVGARSFTVEASAPYASFVQSGVRRPGGSVRTPQGRWVRPTKPIPPRPFMGFSDENISRLSRMLKQHLEQE